MHVCNFTEGHRGTQKEISALTKDFVDEAGKRILQHNSLGEKNLESANISHPL